MPPSINNMKTEPRDLQFSAVDKKQGRLQLTLLLRLCPVKIVEALALREVVDGDTYGK